MTARPTVALICLDGERGAALEDHLSRRGYEVHRVDEPWRAEVVLAGGADIAVVGECLPVERAIDMLRAHAHGRGPLFLLVWNAVALVDKVLALELGAADVVDAEAAGTRELAARIGRLAARRGKSAGDLLVLENATVDLRSALVMHRSGAEEQLSAGQVALIRLFLERAGKVLTRDDIVAAAPAENTDAFDRSIDSRIVRLRRKLDTDSIVTIRGAGYRFDPPANLPGDNAVD